MQPINTYEAFDDEGVKEFRQLSNKVKFQIFWLTYYILTPHFGAMIISLRDKIHYLDALFVSTSAMAGAGLATVSADRLSMGSFAILATLSIIGSLSFMLIFISLIRKYCFDSINNKLVRKSYKVALSEDGQRTVNFFDQFRRAQSVLIIILLSYYLFWLFFGIFFLSFALPSQPELQQRGFNVVDNAAFLSVNAFTNTGLTLTSDSLIGLASSPSAYLLLGILILAGNTLLPVFLRSVLHLLLYAEKLLDRMNPMRVNSTEVQNYKRSLVFILDKPRHLTTHIFSHTQTIQLIFMNAVLITVQYIFFLASTLIRREATQNHSTLRLLGIGLFQTLSVRSAGFSMMDLRELNNGLLVMYCIMMYLSTFPLSTTIQNSGNRQFKSNIAKQLSFWQVIRRPLDTLWGSVRRGKVALKPIEAVNVLHRDMNTESELDSSNTTGSAYMRVRFKREDSITEQDTEINVDELKDLNSNFAHQYLFRHSFFLLLAFIFCAYTEDKLINDPEVEINLFYVAFEIISAYGSVGLSMGIPGQSYSLSGAMTSFGKIVMIGVMVLGKHRGLPDSSDEVMDYDFEELKKAYTSDDSLNEKEKEIVRSENDFFVDDNSLL